MNALSELPARFPATGADVATSITRAVTHHRIGIRLAFQPGALDVSRLAHAVELTLVAEPILACCFRADGWRAYWSRLTDADCSAVFSAVSTADPDAAMDAFQAQEVPDEGPQVAVRLFTSPGADHLAIKVSHVVADGQAGKQYAYLLAAIYSRLARDPDFCPEPNLTPRPTGVDVWRHLTKRQRRAARSAKSWSVPTWTIHGSGSTARGLTYRSTFLEPDTFVRVRAWGRDRGATVNDLLLTAVFRACVRALDPPTGRPLSLMCTADLRRYLPEAEGLPLANMSISGSLDLERVDGESFSETLVRVQERMGVWADQCYGAAPFAGAERLARLGYPVVSALLGLAFSAGTRAKAAGSTKTYPWFTNVGVLDDTKLDFAGARPDSGHMYGPCAKGPSIVPVVSTYKDRLALCVGVCAEDMEPTLADTLLADVVRELTYARREDSVVGLAAEA